MKERYAKDVQVCYRRYRFNRLQGSVMVRLLFLLTVLLTFGFAKEFSFTQEDRERLRNTEIKIERLDTKVDMGFEQIDKRFEQMERQIDRLTQIMIAIFGGQLLLIATIIGLILWDRKSEAERLYRVLKKYNLL